MVNVAYRTSLKRRLLCQEATDRVYRVKDQKQEEGWNISDVSEKTLIENEITILKDQLSALEDRLSNTKEK